MLGLIIQARMCSTRLPRKVSRIIWNNLSVLEFQIARLRLLPQKATIVVATSINKADDWIANICAEQDVRCFRGSETDVLSRYLEVVKKLKFSTIVRITGDCPLVDPVDINRGLVEFSESKVDYLSNMIPHDSCYFPEGSDFEIFSADALARLGNLDLNDSEKEHVTFGFWRPSSRGVFSIRQMSRESDFSSVRYTLDYPEDLEVIEQILERSGNLGLSIDTEKIVEILVADPDLAELNKKYYFGIGWEN